MPERSVVGLRLALAVCLAVSAFTPAVAAAEEPEGGDTAGASSAGAPPNIVLILADDLGYSDISPYGSEIDTPNLQRLAEGGIRFTQMHNTSKCYPSRATLLTGVYAQQCDMWNAHNGINHAVTLGEALGSAGYRTIAVGKHHSKQNLYHRGFDHYYGLRDGASNHFNPGAQRPSDPGKPAQKRPNRAFCFDEKTVRRWTPEDPDYYTTDTFTDWAIELIGKSEEKEDDQPFFLYLAYTAPHDPLQAWPEDIAKYEGRYDAGYAAVRKARYRRQIQMGLLDREHYPLSKPTHRAWDELSEKERQDQARRMEVYAAMIDRMDQNIGRLLDHLRETGELENTLIMFASDNGASAETVRIGSGPIGSMTRWASLGEDWANVGNTPFRYYKNYSYQGGVCTPFIAWWPGVIEPGTITDRMSHFIDIMPTLVDITEATYPQRRDGEKVVPMQGRSLLPVLRGKETRRGGPLFWEWSNGQAVYHDGWKLVKEGNKAPWQVFHLSEDRTETHNLADKRPQLVESLEGVWETWWKETKKYRKN